MAGITVTVGENNITDYVDVHTIVVEQNAEAGLVATCRFTIRDHSGTVSIECKDTVTIEDDSVTLFSGEVANLTKKQQGITRIWFVICQDWNIRLAETAIEEETYAAGVADSYIIGDATYGLFPQHCSDIDSSTYVSTIDASMEEVTFTGMTLLECMDDLCRRTGAIYYVDVNKNLHYFTAEENAAAFSLSTSPDFESSYPFGDFCKVEDASKLANRIFVQGKDVSGWTQDNDSVAAYGERHAVSRDMRITTAQGVTDRAIALLDRYDLPCETYELWTEKDGLSAGEDITITNETWGISSETFSIRRIRMEVLGKDGEKRRYHLVLNRLGNEPARAARQQSLVVSTGETVATDVITTIFDTDAPAAPSVLDEGNVTTGTAEDADGHQIVYAEITWSAVSDDDLDHYQIQISTQSDFTSDVESRDHPADGDRRERFRGLLGNTTYYVRVRAHDWVGNTSGWDYGEGTPHSFTTAVDTTPPVQVANLSAGSSRTLVGLQWDANTEADLRHYEIQRADDVGGSPDTYATIAIATLNFYIDQDFTNGQIAAEDTFWYRVRAIDTSGNTGDWSDADSATLGQISGDHLAANCITANHIAATTITADKMNVSELSAIAADLGSITAGTVTGATIRTAESGARIQMDSTDGIRAFNSGDTMTFQQDVDGSGQIGASGGAVPPLTWNAAGQFNRLQANQLQIGQQYFNNADGLLLLGPNCHITVSEWRSPRGQAATISGAFHQVQGRWQGTRGLVVEGGTTNYFIDPVHNGTGNWTAGGTTPPTVSEQVTAVEPFAGTKCCQITWPSGNDTGYAGCRCTSRSIVIPNGDTYTFSLWIQANDIAEIGKIRAYVTGTSGYFNVAANDLDNWIYHSNGWYRWQLTFTNETGGSATEYFALYATESLTSNLIMYVDGAQFEHSDWATSLCWGGAGEGYSWSGTSHASTSLRTATEVNLSDYVNLINANNEWSMRIVAQMPYDADADWPDNAMLFDLRGADDDNRIYLEFEDSDDVFHLFINGAHRVNSSPQSFVAGDWLDLLVTVDVTNDSYVLYINGVEDSTDDTSLSAPTLTDWTLGCNYNGGEQGGFAIAEYAVFDCVLTATQVAQFYNLHRPLVDAGATQTPGIYILDGRFRMASSTTGNRIEITADEIAGYSSGGTKQFYLQSSTGTAACGGGNVILNSSGIDFVMGASSYGQIRFLEGANIRGYLYSLLSGGAPLMLLRSGPGANTTTTAELELEAMSQDLDYNRIRIYKSNSLGGIDFIIDGTTRLNFDKDGNITAQCADWLICDIAGGMDGIRPGTDEAGYLGSGTYGWYEVNSKAFTDIGCLGWFDDGVELITGEVVGDCEALLRIQKMADGTQTMYDVPRLDYSSLPKVVYKPVYDDEGELIKDRAELTALISVMIGAMRELIRDVRSLKEAQ